MASGSCLLSKEQLLCAICLDMFTQPVSTPCGHNFCMWCITTFWKGKPVCKCPVCMETFVKRPDLKVNTFISGLASQFRSLQVSNSQTQSSEPQQVHCGGKVLCDICTGTRKEAVKSCLECQTSYCGFHLKPHQKASDLKAHTLVDRLASLDEKICKEHTRLLILFCRNDEVLVCDVCANSHHVDHDVIPAQQAYAEMKALLGEAEVSVQAMIQERLQKVQSGKKSVEQRQKETKNAIANCVQDLTTLVLEIQKSQTELVKMMERKQKAAAEETDGFIKSMEEEIAKLQKTTTKLKELRETEDKLCFLQRFPKQLLPLTTDLSSFSFSRQVEAQSMRQSMRWIVSELQMLLNRTNTYIKRLSDDTDGSDDDDTLRYMQQYEEDIQLDPDTANQALAISDDRRQVKYKLKVLPGDALLNPNAFASHLAVLGTRGFSKRNFYFEVFVGKKTEWCLGVATASIQRGGLIPPDSNCGLWAIWFHKDRFESYHFPNKVVFSGKAEKVAVFVDYEGEKVCFYNLHTSKFIYTFTNCAFTEKLYPYLNPCDNQYGGNLGPLVVVPPDSRE